MNKRVDYGASHCIMRTLCILQGYTMDYNISSLHLFFREDLVLSWTSMDILICALYLCLSHWSLSHFFVLVRPFILRQSLVFKCRSYCEIAIPCISNYSYLSSLYQICSAGQGPRWSKKDLGATLENTYLTWI